MPILIRRLEAKSREISTNTIGPFSRLHGWTYEKLKQECLARKQLFKDPDFPANSSSLGLRDQEGIYVWKRPWDICKNPKFMADGFSRFDVRQGNLGDCWLAAGLSAVCDHRSLLEQVVPMDQSMLENYAGIFHFFFWQYGKWVEVIIDDYLPTIKGRLAFIASTDRTEFWSALLEKAYAKLYGSYGALEGGHPVEAMEDFTGGVCEWFELKDKAPSDLVSILEKALVRSSLLSCSIESPDGMENELPNGLIEGHAYTINLIKTITLTLGDKVTLIRMRNPWGNSKEWKLAWSDRSPEWSLVSSSDKKKLEFRRSADGEFWMSLEDFINCFHKLEICNLGPDALTEELAEKCGRHWEMERYEGQWIRNVTAGGCLNYWKTSFYSNPQFRINVEIPDENERTGTLLVALMQMKQCSIKCTTSKFTTIGFAIFKLPETSTGPLTKQSAQSEFFKYKSVFINRREVSQRYKLEPGVYCIIPSTYEPNVERNFILRLYSEQKYSSVVLDEFTSIIENMPLLVADADDSLWDVSPKASAVNVRGVSSSGYQDKVHDKTLYPAVLQDENTGVLYSANLVHQWLTTDQYDDDIAVIHGATEAVSILADYLKLPAEENERRVIAAFGELSDHNMEIDACILCNILTEAYDTDLGFEKFRVDVCRSMVAMLDDDRSGKLSLSEFKKLCRCLKKWVSVFEENDTDKKGFVRSFQLREILKMVGYTVSNQTFHTLVMRYGDPDGELHFQDFLHCLVRLNKMFDVFDDSGLAGSIILNLDEFIQTTMYN